MTNFLLKSGIILMFIAGIFIATAFFFFAIFSLILLAPGFILYNAAIRRMFDTKSSFENEAIRIIDATPRYESAFASKCKSLAKSAVVKFRNFLNKYVD